MNILFVCTGNTCRSPMAEGLMKKQAELNSLDINCSSAGISVYPSSQISQNSVDAMKNYGMDISSHVPEQITYEHVASSDLVLTMTEAHSDILRRACPDVSYKIHSLASYTDTSDIPDPYGGDINEYEYCAEKLNEAISKLCERLKNE